MRPPRSGPVAVVLRALGLGDLLTGLPAMRALRLAFPSHSFLLAAPAALAPLALHSGAVDGVVPAQPLGPIAVDRPALAVNLHGCGPQSHRCLLRTRPARLVAFRHDDVPESAAGPAWLDDERETHRWCRLLRAYGIPADPTRLDLDVRGLPDPGPARGATLVHPGAAAAARRWPADRWAVVARHEAARGRRVLITAGPGEEGLATEVAMRAGLGAAAVAAGRDLLGLAGLVAGAARVVSSDTGVAHLATALRRPSVVLFGPSSPARWGPPASSLHRALWAGRLGDALGEAPDPGLLEIRPPQVIDALAGLPLV